jgi:RNA polymerase sigma factor (sigma-70 family)
MSMGSSAILDSPPVAPGRAAHPRDRVGAHSLAIEIARRDGDALMRTARKFSNDPDDAHDAYQRALELLLEHAATIDRAKALHWMHVVVRREALALRRRHDRHLPFDVDAVDLCQVSDRTDEQLSRIDLAQRASEALAALKDTEAQALCLRAQGLSYDEIADACGWSYTKVNRAVSEGRRAFADHYLGAERGDVCAHTASQISAYVAGDLRGRDSLRLKAHLTRCSACRAQLHAERDADRALSALLPPVTLAASTGQGWLHEHCVGPFTDFAARLLPATEHTLTAKVGVAAVSTLAIAGGGITVERSITPPRPPALRATLERRSPTQSAAPETASVIVNAAATSTGAVIDRAHARAVAGARAAARRQRAAARRARQGSAAAHEFAPAIEEFSAAPRSSGPSTAGANVNRSTAGVPNDAAAPVEVLSDDSGGDATLAVTETP